MTRRDALRIVGTALAGLTGQTISSSSLGFRNLGQPVTLKMDLGQFKEIVISHGERHVVVTPETLIDALTHAHTFNPSGPVAFKLNGRTFDECLGCGELVRRYDR